LRLRQQVQNAEHEKGDHRRYLLGVPSVLHRQDEVRRHYRPCRTLPQEIQLGPAQRGSQRSSKVATVHNTKPEIRSKSTGDWLPVSGLVFWNWDWFRISGFEFWI